MGRGLCFMARYVPCDGVAVDGDEDDPRVCIDAVLSVTIADCVKDWKMGIGDKLWRVEQVEQMGNTRLRVRSNERELRGRRRFPTGEDSVGVVGRPCRP